MSFSIFPRTVYKTQSKISGSIEVKEQLGRYTLHVGGLIQSGGIIRGIWKKALARIMNNELRIINVLVLGLGGGTVVQLIEACYPKAKITGVEIDPEIIKIGKRFFGLGEIKNLEIINADAIDWVKRFYVLLHRLQGDASRRSSPKLRGVAQPRMKPKASKHYNKKFGLIIVDLYIGGNFPEKVASEAFLKNLKKLLSKEGRIIFNRLISPSEDLAGFEEKLKKHFSSLEIIETHTNLLFFARS